MKKSAIVCLLMAFIMVVSTFAMAEAVLSVSGTDATGTDVTGTNALTYGNLNGDAKVDAKDALMILKAAVEKLELTEEQAVFADVYQDGKINARDALYVLRYAVDKIDTLPYIPAPVTGTDVTDTDVTSTNA